jgi:serine/threonine protein phosphatase PrpC
MILLILTIVAVLLTTCNIALAAYMVGILAQVRAAGRPRHPGYGRQEAAPEALQKLTKPFPGLVPADDKLEPEGEERPLDEAAVAALRVNAAGASRSDPNRSESGDTLICDSEEGLFAVFDGIGGEDDGAAARLAAKSLTRWIKDSRAEKRKIPEQLLSPHREGRRLRLAIDRAHAKLLELREERVKTGGGELGCSLVAALRTGNILMVGWLGDARLYRLREGVLNRVTVDQTLASQQMRAGMISEEEAARSPLKLYLTGYLGSLDNPEPGLKEVVLEKDARYMLCNSGLPLAIGEDKVSALLGAAPDPETAAEKLVTEAANADPDDDMTAVVLFAEEA